jgi:hypothetical protein
MTRKVLTGHPPNGFTVYLQGLATYHPPLTC